MMDLNNEISSLEEDIQDFNIEKDVRTSLKTQEELDKLTVDESLNDIERAVFLLSTGQEVQCISVVRNLSYLLTGWQNECIRRVIPKVKELLHTAGSEIQIAATEVFTTIAKEEILPTSLYTQHFLRTIITNINTKDPLTSQAWLDTLVAVINYLPRETVRREVLGLAIAKGQLSQSTASRLSCCSILGAVASKFDANVVKKDIVHTVKQLCQDVEHNVRACMCAHLHAIALALGAEETKKSILEEALELAGDEETQVREAAMDAILNMTPLLDDESLLQNVVPLVCKFCDQAIQHEDSTLLSVAKNFGRFTHDLSGNFNKEQHTWLLSMYRYLCMVGRTPVDSDVEALGDVVQLPVDPSLSALPHSSNSSDTSPEKLEAYSECRRQCSYNFPALVTFCASNAFESELLECATKLCTDPDVMIRKHFAAGFHEVAQTLEANAYLIQPLLVLLLRERFVPGVLEACLRRLPDTLTAVIIRGNLADNKVNGVSEVIAALLAAISRLEQQWPCSWRALEVVVTHLRRLPDVLTSDHIYYKFVPVVFKLLTTNRYLPVREAAACTICVFIRHNRKMDQRREMCDRLIQDLCYSRNYRNRLLFFVACRHMMVLFSRTFFKENLFEHVLKLFFDPVANVRLCLCKILPSLKALLKLPRDRSLHGQLETNVRKLLSSEKDRDVSCAIRQAILELDRTEVAMESLTQFPMLDVDLQDQRKEEEEKLLIAQEEKTKDEDARSLKSHGSGHSSSSFSKSMAKDKKSKKRNSSITLSTNARINGSKDKEKSKSVQNFSSSAVPGMISQKGGIINDSVPGTSLSALYNMANTNAPSHNSRNLANHFSHSSYLSGTNPAVHGPSTALGHKSPHYQALTQTRSSQSASNPGAFVSSLSSHQQTSQTGSSASSTNAKSTRKLDRRKTSASVFQSTTNSFDVNTPFESRARRGSAGSTSSGGSGGHGPKSSVTGRRKPSLPGSPTGTAARMSKSKSSAGNR